MPADNWTTGRKDGRTEGQTNGRTDGRTDILYCHSWDLNLWPASARAARNHGPRALIYKKRTGRSDREIERRTDINTNGERDENKYKLNWTPVWKKK